MDRAVLSQFAKGDLIALLLGQEARHTGGDGDGVASTDRRIGAPTRAEQQQQRQATVQRRAEEAGAGEPVCGNGLARRPVVRRAIPGEHFAPDRDTRHHHRPLSADLHDVRHGVDHGDGDRPRCPAGVGPPRTATADRHGTPRARLPLRGLRRAKPGRYFPKGSLRPCSTARRSALRTLSPALPVVAREASGRIAGRPLRGKSGHRDDRSDRQPPVGASKVSPMRCATTWQRHR